MDPVSLRLTCFVWALLLAASTASAGLAHEYRFAGNGTDSAGSANGSVGTSVTFSAAGVPACLGSAAVFGTGVGGSADDEIIVANAAFMDFGTSDFSIAFWVRRDPGAAASAYGVFDALSGTLQGWQLLFLDTNVLRVRLEDTGGGSLLTDNNSAIAGDGSWHHVVVSVDRDQPDGLKWYVDGNPDGTGNPTVVAGAIDPNQDLRIGAVNDNLGLNGALALAQFYDHALTPGEVTTLFGAGSTADGDGDGVPDVCDPCPLDSPDDTDGDGVCDSHDICPGFDDHVDTDADAVPDGCDICPGSDDTIDTDGDGVPDACDPCPLDNPDDTDGDGVCESDDICPGFDDSGPDSDADGVPDGCDLCSGTVPGASVDADGCPPFIGPDFDRDGDVDGDDFAAFSSCASGPTVPIAAGCEHKDFDSDGDGDLSDFAILQRCFSGENFPAEPTCAKDEFCFFHGNDRNGACVCDDGWVGARCSLPCDGGADVSFCGSPSCSGNGQCDCQTLTDPYGSGPAQCCACTCDSLVTYWPYVGDTCACAGSGAQIGDVPGSSVAFQPEYICNPLFCSTSSIDVGILQTVTFEVWFRINNPMAGVNKGQTTEGTQRTAAIDTPLGTFGVPLLSKFGCTLAGAAGCTQGKSVNYALTVGLLGDPGAGSHLRFGDGTNWAVADKQFTDLQLTTEEWHHAAAVYEYPTKTVRLYMDGQAAGSYMAGEQNPTITGVPNRGPLRIGEFERNGMPSTYFVGDIAEVRIWNVLRTHAEIVDNMFHEITDPAELDKLVFYAKFNERNAEPQTLPVDSSSSNLPAVINGAIEYEIPSPVFEPDNPATQLCK